MAAALVALVVLLGAGTALGALGGGSASDRAGAEARDARQAVSVRVLTTSQRTILRQGSMRVRVRMGRAGALRVFGIARGARRGSRRHIATRSRLVRLRRPGVRVVRLRLTRTGRRIVRGCRGARLRGGGRLRLRGARRSSRVRPGPARALRGASESARCDRGGEGGSGSPGGGAPGAGGQPGGGAGTGPAGDGGPGSGGGNGPGGGDPGGGDPGGGDPGGGDPDPESLGELDTSSGDDCDFLDPSVCLYPFPNDRFTTEDESTVTGRRLNLDLLSMPANREQKPIDPADQNRADGFSPGNMIITKVPGLDSQEAFDQTGAVPITDMERSFDEDQPVVVINADTLERHLIWAEVDANPANPEDVTLIVRPGTNFEEGTRYIVALRDMRDADGAVIPPREEFRAYRDEIVTENPDIEARRDHYEDLFATLGEAGIERENLFLTWDFTVASEESLAGRAVEMRDDAFAQLGDENLADLEVAGDSPTFVQNADLPDNGPGELEDVDGYREFEPCSEGMTAECEDGEHAQTARRITGTIAVPCYLDLPACAPGAGFVNGQPAQTPGNTAPANVICTVPHKALEDGASPARPSLYGHGLLGSAGEVAGGSAQPMGQEHNFVFCATDWIGMSTSDAPNVVSLLQDLSKFNTLVDRIQQGYVNFMYLGRWMIHPEGASALAGFRDADAAPLIDTRELFYDGNSQGGILSGGLTALSPDVLRSVHGVPGMNYSTLLRRSVDFDLYANGDVGTDTPVGLYDNYPNELERPLILSLIQLLWDRGEANGYAHHMTDDPLPNSPFGKAALLHPAFGDHQVANVAADVEARTIGASAYRPVFYDGRSPDMEPLYGLPSIDLAGDEAFTGSAIVYWDGGPADGPFGRPDRGTPAPPTANVPPREGRDPHSFPRSDPEAREQKSAFMSIGGSFFNPCGMGPCYSDDFAGPP